MVRITKLRCKRQSPRSDAWAFFMGFLKLFRQVAGMESARGAITFIVVLVVGHQAGLARLTADNAAIRSEASDFDVVELVALTVDCVKSVAMLLNKRRSESSA